MEQGERGGETVAGEGGNRRAAEGERGGDAVAMERGEETERGEGNDAGAVMG